MENPLQRYTNIRFMIIDDFSEFRLSLKQMVESFGAKHIDICVTAEEGVTLYAEHYHQVVLVDYNLGDGLSGLQLLEELNHRDLLKPETIFILTTGETAMELVMGALEYRPDDYLAKPFTRNTLKTRLDKLVQQKETLKPIYQAINKNKPNLAIDICDAMILKHGRLAMLCLKIKGEIYLKSGQYAKASNVYTSVIEQRELNWALMGLAKSCAGMSKLPKVVNLCEQIICKNKHALEAYDLLAETLCDLGEFEKAYTLLMQATEISPNSLIRQRNLGLLALRYQDIEQAYSAFKKVILLGKGSIKIKPDDYISDLQVISLIQIGSFGSLSRRAPKEYVGTYREITRKFPHDIQLKLAVELHQSLVKNLAGDKDASIKEIHQTIDKIMQIPDKIKPFLLSEIIFVEKHVDDEALKNKINDNIESDKASALTQDNVTKAQNYNRQGMLKFKEHDYLASKNAFKTALINSPTNINIALNLLQCLYKLAIEGNKSHVEQALLTLCAQALDSIEPSDHRYAHSKSLFNHIKAKLAS